MLLVCLPLIRKQVKDERILLRGSKLANQSLKVSLFKGQKKYLDSITDTKLRNGATIHRYKGDGSISVTRSSTRSNDIAATEGILIFIWKRTSQKRVALAGRNEVGDECQQQNHCLFAFFGVISRNSRKNAKFQWLLSLLLTLLPR
jgi:hypothetical protein